jgi:serine/threonine-protein kinase RsbW
MNGVQSAVLDPTEHFAIKVDVGDVRFASEWLERVCCENDVPTDQIYRLDLCLNEALANIIVHGGESASAADVFLAMEFKTDTESAAAALTVSDAGKAFNPLAASIKPAPLTLADATPGGLGLTMMSLFSDDLSHAYHEGRNHLTFTVRWSRSQ